MKRIQALVTTAALSLAAILPARAEVPLLVNCQGRVIDGTNVLNGNLPLTLRLYDAQAGGTMLYQDTSTVLFSDGLYSTWIGDNPAGGIWYMTNALAKPQVYLEVEVDSRILAPRSRLVAAPYAILAAGLPTGTMTTATLADRAVTSNKIDWTTMPSLAFVRRTGDTMTGPLTNSSGITAARYYDIMNTAPGNYALALGGDGNSAGGYGAAAIGGEDNKIVSGGCAIAGGREIALNSEYGFAGGGLANVVSGGWYNAIVGGNNNEIVGPPGSQYGRSIILGGDGNFASNSPYCSAILGGESSIVAADHCLAAGRRTRALHDGCFVWGDSRTNILSTSTSNQVLFRAQNGFGLNITPFNCDLQVKDADTVGGRLRVGEASSALGEKKILFGDGEYVTIGEPAWSDDTLEIHSGVNDCTFFSGGDVGIGVSNTEARLHVAGGNWNVAAGNGDFHIGDSVNRLKVGVATGGGGAGHVRMFATGTYPGLILGINETEVLKVYTNYCSVNVLEIRGGADLTEPFEVADAADVPRGSLLVIDAEHPGKLKLSASAYDHRVAGVVSGAGGLNPGLTLSQAGVAEGDVKVALSGRVYALADAAAGPIRPGDLLTTSDTPGHAMKASDRERAAGTVIGKAMSGLPEGRGLVLVLVNLQ